MSTALGPWDKYICLHAAHVTFHLNLSVVMADVYPGCLDQDMLQTSREIEFYEVFVFFIWFILSEHCRMVFFHETRFPFFCDS